MSWKQSRTQFYGAAILAHATGFWREVCNEDVHSGLTATGIEPRTSGTLFTAPDALVQSATNRRNISFNTLQQSHNPEISFHTIYNPALPIDQLNNAKVIRSGKKIIFWRVGESGSFTEVVDETENSMN